METLRYGKGKLVGVALLCALGAGFFLLLYLFPEWAAQSRKGRLFATGLGHSVLIPLIWIAFTIATTRAMMILAGDRAAVEAGPDALVLKTWWRTRRVPWADVGDASIRLMGAGNTKAWQLVILHRDGSGSTEFKLPLATTELHQARYQEFVDSLLANYMAKKAAGLIEAPGPAPAARPVFGRKIV